MELGTFEQVAAVLAVCVLAGTLARLLRQPLVVGLLAAGIAVGPDMLGLVEATGEIELLAEIGISLLVFVVGLKLDVRLVRRLGPVALATGLGQVAFTSAFGFLIARALGFDPVPAAYIAVALTFSSTIIIVKLLSDKRELDDLHGRIALGFLIVQDLVVVLAMIAITAIGDGRGEVAGVVAGVVVRGLGLLLVVGLVARYAVPRVVDHLARTPELFMLAAVTWAVALAAASTLLGFSAEVGAFLAGVSLASTPYREALSGRLTTLRDFLLVFFFIELGVAFELSRALDQLGAAVLFSAFVLIGNPIIVMAIMGWMGYRKQVAFKAGLTVAQISEFSLILVALGVSQGHVGPDVVGLVTAVGLVTISGSTYLILNSDAIYTRLEPMLGIFERARPSAAPSLDERGIEPEFLVVGVGRLGAAVLDDLHRRGTPVVGVDFDPRHVRSPGSAAPVIFGDAEDPHLPEHLPLAHVRVVISTLRNRDANLHLVTALRQHGYLGEIAVAADDEEAEDELRRAGADLVVRPLALAAEHLLMAQRR
jgi:Kef-type K+ transport system membrane component KefB